MLEPATQRVLDQVAKYGDRAGNIEPILIAASGEQLFNTSRLSGRIGREPSTSAASTKLFNGSVTPHASARATCWTRNSATSSAAGADRAIVRMGRRFQGFGFSDDHRRPRVSAYGCAPVVAGVAAPVLLRSMPTTRLREIDTEPSAKS